MDIMMDIMVTQVLEYLISDVLSVVPPPPDLLQVSFLLG